MRRPGRFVHVYSEPGQGTTVRVYLRAALERPRGQAHADARADGAPARGGHETILVVEDEPALRRAASRALQRLGYRVLTAHDGADALVVFHGERANIDLILSDPVMPGMTGPQLEAALREEGAEIPLLFASGYSDHEWVDRGHLAEGAAFLVKPWTVAELAGKVREVLDGAEGASVDQDGGRRRERGALDMG